jgi:hypothetical protein
MERRFEVIRGLRFECSTMARAIDGAAVVHVRFAGETFGLPLTTLEIGPMCSDARIRRAVAENLMIPLERLAAHVIDRHASGNLTIRPADRFV